eukprot:1245537-Rhodomonas_salina.1
MRLCPGYPGTRAFLSGKGVARKSIKDIVAFYRNTVLEGLGGACSTLYTQCAYRGERIYDLGNRVPEVAKYCLLPGCWAGILRAPEVLEQILVRTPAVKFLNYYWYP